MKTSAVTTLLRERKKEKKEKREKSKERGQKKGQRKMKRMEGENVYLKNAAMKGRSGMAGVEGSKGVSCPVE